jgi:hypothetical protein
VDETENKSDDELEGVFVYDGEATFYIDIAQIVGSALQVMRQQNPDYQNAAYDVYVDMEENTLLMSIKFEPKVLPLAG